MNYHQEFIDFAWRLMWFSYKVVYGPVKLLCASDTLSRAPVFHTCIETTQNDLCLKVENHVDRVVAYFPVSSDMLQKISGEQFIDPIRSLVIKYCRN